MAKMTKLIEVVSKCLHCVEAGRASDFRMLCEFHGTNILDSDVELEEHFGLRTSMIHRMSRSSVEFGKEAQLQESVELTLQSWLKDHDDGKKEVDQRFLFFNSPPFGMSSDANFKSIAWLENLEQALMMRVPEKSGDSNSGEAPGISGGAARLEGQLQLEDLPELVPIDDDEPNGSRTTEQIADLAQAGGMQTTFYVIDKVITYGEKVGALGFCAGG